MGFEAHGVLSVKQGWEAFDLWARPDLLLLMYCTKCTLFHMVTVFYFFSYIIW